MSPTSLLPSSIQTHLRDFDIVLASWFALLVLLLGQCMAYEAFVNQSTMRWAPDLFWYIEDWGLWLVAAPLVFGHYYRNATSGAISLKQFLPVAVLSCLVLLALEYLLKLILKSPLSGIAFLLYFAPRYALAMLVLTLIWIWRNKTLVASCWQSSQQVSAATEISPKTSPADPICVNVQASKEMPKGLVAYKGRDKVFIHLQDIQGVIAARNYLDIYCPQGEFIVRDTMKNMESSLSSGDFVRTHRSALVRLSAVQRFKKLAYGNGVAVLENGMEIPVSKSFMSSLNQSVFH